MPDLDLTTDHRALDDDLAARRYFKTFERITRTLSGVAGAMTEEATLTEREAEVIEGYVRAISSAFRALSMKYLISGQLKPAPRHLSIDFHESGFPVFQEIVTMANDCAQAAGHLNGLPDAITLKEAMIKVILNERRVPVDLQYALSQRLYYERLMRGGLFFAQMHPQIEWMKDLESGRKRFLIHWGVYDSQINVPVVYLMEVEDSGKRALPKDEARWPAVQAHLLAQSASTLKLLTIAKGFDADFTNLHPKRLRRVYLGPMYSSAFTLQSGPIRDVLEEVHSAPDDDWALAWTSEDLLSARVEIEKGWFSATETEVFALDPLAGRGVETGATSIVRNLVLPQKPFQVLAEKDPEGFRSVRKFVVGREGRVMIYA